MSLVLRGDALADSVQAIENGAGTMLRPAADHTVEGSLMVWPTCRAPVQGAFRAVWRPRQQLYG